MHDYQSGLKKGGNNINESALARGIDSQRIIIDSRFFEFLESRILLLHNGGKIFKEGINLFAINKEKVQKYFLDSVFKLKSKLKACIF